MQTPEVAGAIVYVSARIEHLLQRLEAIPVELEIDLHATDVDQPDSRSQRRSNDFERRSKVRREKRRSLDIQGKWLQNSIVTRLGRRDCIENAQRNLKVPGRTQHLSLTAIKLMRVCFAGDRVVTTQDDDQSAKHASRLRDRDDACLLPSRHRDRKMS